MQRWLEKSRLAKATGIHLVHGAPDALDAMREHLRRTTHYRIEVAGYRHILTL